MSENARPPVAVRIVRPYASEDELLDNELETIGKTSVILIGAHPRPTGVILRFELSLASGVAALRGEGRVLGHKESAFRGQPGLALRFTRLDPKSKALVDRATSMREAKAQAARTGSVPPPPPPPAPSEPSAREPMATTPDIPDAAQLAAMTAEVAAPEPAPPEPAPEPAPPEPVRTESVRPEPARPESVRPEPRPSRAPSARPSARPAAGARGASRPPAHRPPDPALARALTEETPAPPPVRATREVPELDLVPRRAPAPVASEPAVAPELTSALLSSHPPPSPEPERAAPTPEPARAAPPEPPSGTARVIPPPPDRDAVLARLRERARALQPEQITAILEGGRRA